MSIAQDIRNAYDNRDREALERAIERIEAATAPWPGAVTITGVDMGADDSTVVGVIGPDGRVTIAPPGSAAYRAATEWDNNPAEDCTHSGGCKCVGEHTRQRGGCLFRTSVIK